MHFLDVYTTGIFVGYIGPLLHHVTVPLYVINFEQVFGYSFKSSFINKKNQ